MPSQPTHRIGSTLESIEPNLPVTVALPSPTSEVWGEAGDGRVGGGEGGRRGGWEEGGGRWESVGGARWRWEVRGGGFVRGGKSEDH